MELALISIVALVVAIAIGAIRSDVNVGVVALALAFAVALFAPALTEGDVALALPNELLLMLIGVSLLFGMARSNGTLDWLSHGASAAARSRPALLPPIFFGIAFLLSAIGPGNIAATAVVAPLAMAIAARNRISYVLMAIMVCTGANAGAFSPVAPTGVINSGLLLSIGVDDPDVPLQVFLASALLQSITAVAAYILFKGYRLNRIDAEHPASMTAPISYEGISLSPPIVGTLVAMGILLVLVLGLRLPVGAVSFILAVFLALFRFSDLQRGIKSVPWGVILLIGGISVLIKMMETSGGIDLATSFMVEYSIPAIKNGMLAFTTGLLSTVSSSSGVVIPLYIPLLPSLAEGMGGGDIVSMAIAVDLGSHLVDVSPLSSLGALCIAAIPEEEARQKVFTRLFIWGLAMSVVGGILAILFLDLPG